MASAETPALSASPTTKPVQGHLTQSQEPPSLLFWEQPWPASPIGARSCRQTEVTKLSARADSPGGAAEPGGSAGEIKSVTAGYGCLA